MKQFISFTNRPRLKAAICTLIILFSIGIGNAWGAVAVVSYNEDTQDTNTAVGSSNVSSGSAGRVSWSATSATWKSSKTRWDWASGSSVTFTVSSGYVITEIETYTTSTKGTFSVSPTATITGNGTATCTISGLSASSVTITTSGNHYIKDGYVHVTYESSASCSTPPTIGASGNSSISVTGATVSCTGITKGDCDIDEWGFFYKTGSSGVTTSDTKVQVSAAKSTTNVSSFNKSFTELNPNTHYYFAAYAKVGSNYYLSSETDFTTKTLTSSSSNTTYGTVSRSGRVITGTLKAGGSYGSPAYTVTGASGGSTTTVEREGNRFTVTSNSTSNITVTINFEAKGCTDHGASSITGGTSTGYTYGPVSNYYNYGARQILYTKEDLGLAAGKKGTIKSIYFEYAYTSAITKKDKIKIYMANTTLETLSTSSYVPYASFTEVYSGDMNFTVNGWNEISITNFEYDGVGNLAVLITDNSGKYDGSSYVFKYKDAPFSGAQIYKNLDGSFPDPSSDGTWADYATASRPNTKFCIEESDMTPATVTLMDNGATITEVSAGAGVTLPSRAGCTGYTFAGWTKTWVAPQSSWTTTAPTIIPAGSYTPSANENLYPVYTKTEGGGSPEFSQYQQVALGGTITAGKYLISTGSYTMAGSGKTGVSLTPGTTEAAAREYTVAIVSGTTITIKGPDNKYIGGLDKADGLTFSTTTPSSDDYRWVYTENGIQNKSITGRHIKAYSTTDFRHYGTGNGTLTYFYKRIETSGSTTSYISVPNCCTDPGLNYGTGSVTKTYGADAFTNTLTNSHSVAVTYSSSDETVATVNGSGQVTILKAGSTTITASSAAQTVAAVSYCADEASYTLTVNKANISPTLTYTPNSVAAGSNTSAPTVGGNPGSGGVTYAITSASPSGCATINTSTGVVTGVAVGSVTVTATVAATDNYNGGSATANVTITAASGYCISAFNSSNNGITSGFSNGGSGNEYTLNYTIPGKDGSNNWPQYWIGENEAYQSFSASANFADMHFTHSDATLGLAEGATGKLHIWDDNKASGSNLWVKFEPDGYGFRWGGAGEWDQAANTKAFTVDPGDANVWWTDLVTLDGTNNTDWNYYVGLKTSSGYVYSGVDNEASDSRGVSRTRSVTTMKVSNGTAGSYKATNLNSEAAGTRGKFRIWDNNISDYNFVCHFVPYYRVTYNGSGASGSTAASADVCCEGNAAARTVVAAANGFTVPTGKTFGGWASSPENAAAGTVAYAAGADVVLTQSIVLYAIWTDINYTVTVNQNPSVGATTTGQTTTAHYNGTINLTTTVPSGYRFVNWTTSDGFSITNSTSATTASFTMPTKNVTVTANFQQTHSITWMVNGASYSTGDPDVVVDHGGSISTLPTAPSAPTGCPDKVFMGWSEKNSGTTAKDDSYYDDLFKTTAPSPINSDKIFYAVFADKDDSGGSGSTNITISSTWTKSGYSGGGTAGTTGVILVTQDGVTLTHDKGYISTDVRMYKDYNCVISVVSPSKITRIEVTTADAGYDARGWDTLDDNYETSYDSGAEKWNGVWANATGATSVTFGVTKQVRLSSIKVYYTSTSYENYVTLCSSCTTPSNLAVSGITSTGGKVTWNGVSVDAPSGFKVLWSTSSSRPEPTTGNNADVAAGTNEYTISGLTPATHYYVWVQSKCNSGWSSSADFYTNAKITYAAGTGASGSMDPKEVTYNTDVVVDACTFTAPTGKTFNGWVSNTAVHVNGGGSTTTAVPAEATINNLTAAITLTAQWRDLAVYHVTFSADNGTVAGGASQDVLEGGTLTFPSVTSTTCGTFSGWVEAAYDNTAAPSGATYHAVGDELAADPAMEGKTYYAVYRVATGAPTTINDAFTYSDFTATGVSYVSFSGVSSSSSAVYAGETAVNNSVNIQLRSNNSTSGIVSTGSGGTVKKVSVVWASGNTSGRTLDVYGKNTAYSAASDLYGDGKGTKLGSIKEGTSTEITIDGDYEYVGLRSSSGAAYLSSITFQWYGAPMKYQTSPACTPVVSMTSSLSSFTYVYGNGPSASQSFTVSGTNLSTNPLVVTAPTNYEVCKTSGGDYTTSVSYTPSDGTVTDQTVYIRLKAGLNVGTYNYAAASGVSAASSGATTRTAALNGSVTKATGSIAFTDFNAGDHYEAEWTGSAILVPYNYILTGDGTLTTTKVDGRGGTVDTENKKWSLTNEGTYQLRLTLGNGTNYTGAGPVTADFVIYKADRFYDNLHGNDVIVKRNDTGEDHYTIPTLSDETRETSGSCSETHYHFMGWVPESALSTLSNDAAYDAVMITGGGTQAASGTNYYAVWAEE